MLSRSPFTVSATASSEFPVTFHMVGGSVTLNGDPVTLVSRLDAGNRLRRFVTVA